MNRYRILSKRIGTPGELWTPGPGVNVEALVRGGFIEALPDDGNDQPAPKAAPTINPKPKRK